MADYDRQRAERDFNMNPPTNAPGQGDDGWGNLFGDSSSADVNVNNFTGVDTDINSILNNQQGTGTNGQTQGEQLNQGNQGYSVGDKIGSKLDEAAVKGAEGAWKYLKSLVSSLKNNTQSDWNKLGTRICKLSSVLFIISMVFFILSITVLPSLGDGIDLAIGSCLSLIVGLVLVGFNKKGIVDENTSSNNDSLNNNDMNDFSDDFSDAFSDDEDEVEESNYSDDDSEEDYSDLFNDSFNSANSSGNTVDLNDSFNAEEVVNSLPSIPAGQYTRQYLFETFSKVLPLINPSFSDMINISDTSDEFMMFEDYLRRSAQQTGINDDKLDELQLLEVRKNLFIIQLLATRPTGLKEKDIADGVADCYKRDNYGRNIEGREGVFCRVNSQVGTLIIDIFLCNSVMISLGDIYRKKADFILDTNNIMPLIWGVNEVGDVFCYDGMKDGNGGIIISGESRSGKSWKGVSLIAQMCMFMSPKELELYFFDVKGKASDYDYLSRVLPHCKGFCGDSLKFNDTMSKILEKESKRRTDLLAGKYVNVKDYNKDHPYDKIPTIYFVVDEMATAMSEMRDKDIEIRKKFDSLLIQIATKYPYLELKLLLFPHRIVNDVINKTVSSMISTRSVMGNVPADELKSALDIKKDFPYSLVKAGDMAIKTKSLNNGNAVYSHSEVLTTDTLLSNKMFDYIGTVWRKLEPDCKGMQDNRVSTNVGNSDNSDSGTVSANNRNVSGRRREARDTSIYADDFTYTPDNSSIQESQNSEEEDVDESFWEDMFK